MPLPCPAYPCSPWLDHHQPPTETDQAVQGYGELSAFHQTAASHGRFPGVYGSALLRAPYPASVPAALPRQTTAAAPACAASVVSYAALPSAAPPPAAYIGGVDRRAPPVYLQEPCVGIVVADDRQVGLYAVAYVCSYLLWCPGSGWWGAVYSLTEARSPHPCPAVSHRPTAPLKPLLLRGQAAVQMRH